MSFAVSPALSHCVAAAEGSRKCSRVTGETLPIDAKEAPKAAAATPPKPAVAKPSGATQKVTTVGGITEYRLPNGLQVLLFPDASKPTMTVNIT